MSSPITRISVRLDKDTNEKLNFLLVKNKIKISKNKLINNLLTNYFKKNFLFKDNNIEDEILEILYNNNREDLLNLIRINENKSFEIIKKIDFLFNYFVEEESLSSKSKNKNRDDEVYIDY